MATKQAAAEPDQQSIVAEREDLRRDLANWLAPLMTLLGLITLILLLVQFSVTLRPRASQGINTAQVVIWAFFLIEFIAELLLACDKRAYLRDNWFVGITVLLPALRVFRALRVLMAVRHVNTLALLVRGRRSIETLREMIPGRETAYLALLTALVVAIGTAVVYHFEQGQEGAQIHTLGDALWWAACLVTTINNGFDPVSVPGRLAAILMRIYAVGVFGLIAGNLASVLLQRRQETADAGR